MQKILELAKLELRTRKRWDRYDAIILLVLSVLALITTAYSLSLGVRIGNGMFTSNVKLGDPLFMVSKNPDIVVSKGVILLRGGERSLAAFDEFRMYIKRIYDEWLWKTYGSKAFPVMLRLIRIKTKVILPNGLKRVSKHEAKGIGHRKVVRPTFGIGKKAPLNYTQKKKGTRTRFLTPDELKPPSMLDKIIYAFGFVIPVYFVVQVYSSSAVEDKIKRRLEVLFTALSPLEVTLGKMMPYATLSVVLSTIALVLLGKSPVYEIYLIPVIAFLLTLNTFTAMISRSYREMTFLTIVLSIAVTVYLFMPAIFSEFLFGGISPITRILNGELNLKSYIISTFQFWSMTIVLLYLSINSIEVMYSQNDPIWKILEISKRTITNYSKLFLATLLSIPFVFMIEFFTLSMIFMFKFAIYVVLLIIAIVEEFFKCTLIYSSVKNGHNGYTSAIVAAFGFFLGEKAIILPYLPIRSLTYLPIPLVAHIFAAMIFVITLRFGFRKALAASSIFHALYDGVIVWSLLG